MINFTAMAFFLIKSLFSHVNPFVFGVRGAGGHRYMK